MIKVKETQIKVRLKERLAESTISIFNDNNCNCIDSNLQFARGFIFCINPEGVLYFINRICFLVYRKPASFDTIRRIKKIINSTLFLKFVPISLIIRIKSHFIRH